MGVVEIVALPSSPGLGEVGRNVFPTGRCLWADVPNTAILNLSDAASWRLWSTEAQFANGWLCIADITEIVDLSGLLIKGQLQRGFGLEGVKYIEGDRLMDLVA